jgi:hypothetical protein
MSIRESIAANLVTTLSGMTSPITLKKVERNPFDFEKLSNAQFPACWIQSGEETREDSTMNESSSKRAAVVNYRVIGFVKSSTIDTARNELIEGIEEVLDADRTRGGYALDTQVTEVGTDEGAIDPVGGIIMNVRIEYTYVRGLT